MGVLRLKYGASISSPLQSIIKNEEIGDVQHQAITLVVRLFKEEPWRGYLDVRIQSPYV